MLERGIREHHEVEKRVQQYYSEPEVLLKEVAKVTDFSKLFSVIAYSNSILCSTLINSIFLKGRFHYINTLCQKNFLGFDFVKLIATPKFPI